MWTRCQGDGHSAPPSAARLDPIEPSSATLHGRTARVQRDEGVTPMANDSITLIASVIAATSSLAAVALNIRSSSRVELEKWRRQEEGKLIAQFVEAFDEAIEKLREASASKSAFLRETGGSREESRERMGKSWMESYQLYLKGRELRAELELIAGRKVVAIAEKMLRNVEGIHHWVRPAGPADLAEIEYTFNSSLDLRADLIVAARAELSIERFYTTRKKIMSAIKWTFRPLLRLYSRYKARRYYKKSIAKTTLAADRGKRSAR